MDVQSRTASRALGFISQTEQVELTPLQVRGEFPAWLRGTALRSAPAMFEIGTRSVGHWFDGLAMLNAFYLNDGQVSYASRFLDTPSYRTARDKGEDDVPITINTDPCRRLGSRVASIFTSDYAGSANANVSVYRLGERYLAATEVPAPIEFDPETLATLGPVKFGGVARNDVHGPFAHPHFDVHGDGSLLVFVTRFSARNTHRVFAIDPVTLRRREIGSVPAGRTPHYMHSFALTENHIVLMEQPLTYNLVKILTSGRFSEGYRWRPGLGTRFTVLNRHTGETVCQPVTDPFFYWHQSNAFEEAGELVIDLVAMPDAACVWDLDLEKLRDPDHRPAFYGELRRYRVPLDGGPVSCAALSDARLEFPRINYGRVNTRPYQYVYGISYAGTDSDWFDEIVKIDVKNQKEIRWSETGCYPSEPMFVAHPDAGDDAAEDAGVILSIVLDAQSGTSFLVALDATDLTELARARAPHHLPFNFHQDFLR